MLRQKRVGEVESACRVDAVEGDLDPVVNHGSAGQDRRPARGARCDGVIAIQRDAALREPIDVRREELFGTVKGDIVPTQVVSQHEHDVRGPTVHGGCEA